MIYVERVVHNSVQGGGLIGWRSASRQGQRHEHSLEIEPESHHVTQTHGGGTEAQTAPPSYSISRSSAPCVANMLRFSALLLSLQ